MFLSLSIYFSPSLLFPRFCYLSNEPICIIELYLKIRTSRCPYASEQLVSMIVALIRTDFMRTDKDVIKQVAHILPLTFI